MGCLESKPTREAKILIRKPSGESAISNITLYRAIYDYDSRANDDLSFKQGDRMELLDNSETTGWMRARHVLTGVEGYIPSNYVIKDDDDFKNQDWWFETDRREAEKMLMYPGNPKGTFLIRSSSDLRSCALSVRDWNESKKDYTAKHYRIRSCDDGKVYISSKRIFPTFNDLIDHYRKHRDGLCCELRNPCPREPEIIPFKEIEVERSSIRLGKKLGAGNFGEVFAAKFRDTIDVAVKTLKPGAMTVQDFLREAKVMHELRHRKLVQLMGVCTVGDPLYIITELMVNGSLLKFLRDDTKRSLTLGHLADFAAQIADGMSYLEEKNYVHRDLRAANILVGENHVVKVADFGLARLTSVSEDYMARAGTKFPVKWTAPEAAMYHRFSVKSDVWSFGVLLYEIFTYGRVPYPGISNADVTNRVEQGYRMSRPTGVEFPQPLYDVMIDCWRHAPEERPTFSYLFHYLENYFVSIEGPYDEQI